MTVPSHLELPTKTNTKCIIVISPQQAFSLLNHWGVSAMGEQYLQTTSNLQLQTSNLELPTVLPDRTSAWAQYSVRVQNRDEVQIQLRKKGIPTAVHYPVPLHLQECFEYLDYKKGDFPISEQISDEIISLPMNPYLKDEEIAYIVEDLLK